MNLSAKTLDFLFENKLNNSKDWFHAHKADYQRYVVEPLTHLVLELEPVMREMDPNITFGAKPTRCISRIYRDTRFAKDKTLFRDNMWLLFSRDKKVYDSMPAFYVDISSAGSSYGCGYYHCSTETTRCYREMILAQEKPFLLAQQAYNDQSVFQINGDLYKRSKAPDEPEAIRNWVDRKNVYFACQNNDFSQVFSADFGKQLAEELHLLKPVYDFLLAVESRKSHTQP